MTCCWSIGLAAALAPGQRWQLPAHGAAEFRCESAAGSAVATAADPDPLAPAGPVPERYLPRLQPAAWLCQGELRADGGGIADPPRDLRDVVRAVALELGGRTAFRFHRVPPFGDLVLTAAAEPIDANGRQRLRCTVARQPCAALPGDGPDVRQRLAPLCDLPATGTLVVDRTVDRERGLVRAFTAELALRIDEGEQHLRKLALRDQWTLVAVHENQDADFRQRVGAAVRAGAAWLRRALAGLDQSWLEDKDEKPPRSFGSGRLALAVQTLLHCDVPPQDPVLAPALTELGRRRLVDTYSLGVALLAMASKHAPPREAEQLRDGTLAARRPRQLDDQERRLAARWLKELLRNVDRRADPAADLRFNYTAGARFDNSIEQYGLLGLDAAQLCGLPPPPTAWHAAAAHLLAVQAPAHGRGLDLALLLHRDLAAGRPVRRVHVSARGFAYQDADEPPYGSMTAAGVTGLVLARAGLLQAGAPAADLRELDRAIDDGFGWLAAEFTTRANPGFAGRAHAHWYYWLYCLERACALAGIARLQDRDWYYEGALQLLAQQQPNGSFRGDGGLLVEGTCFALLFLKQATLPVATGAAATGH